MDDKNTLESAVKILVSGKYQLDFELTKLNEIDKLNRVENLREQVSLRSLTKLSRKFVFRVPLKCKGISLPKMYYSEIISVSPWTFIKTVLPFSQLSFDFYSGDTWIEDIDPFLVMGGTYGVYTKTREKIFETIDRLNSLPDRSPGDVGTALYCKIGSLPLYVAYEGKNRVLMYQSVKKKIRAIVKQTNFPRAEELLIRKILPFNLYGLSCCNSSFYTSESCGLVILPFSEIVLPLLNSYGVKMGSPIFSLRALLYWRALRKNITSTLLRS